MKTTFKNKGMQKTAKKIAPKFVDTLQKILKYLQAVKLLTTFVKYF